MKNNSNNHNLAMLEIFYKDAGYLIRKFSPIFESSGSVLTELNNNYIKFHGKDHELLFQYDAIRYGLGRELVDIILIANNVTYRLSQIIKEKDQNTSLDNLISIGSKKYIPPINTIKDLFEKHLLTRMSQV